jgi:hypothetical protein
MGVVIDLATRRNASNGDDPTPRPPQTPAPATSLPVEHQQPRPALRARVMRAA